jgi:hypothetical protein
MRRLSFIIKPIIGALLLIGCLCLSPARAQKEMEHVTKPPDKPAQPIFGSLVITSEPASVEIFINNERYGATKNGQLVKPIMLKEGTYKVLAKQNEYEDFFKEIYIRPGQPLPVFAKLTPRFGFVAMKTPTIEANARITLDGETIAQDSLIHEADSLMIKTTPGKHTLIVSQPGYVTVTQPVDVEAGKPAFAQVVLEREPIKLRLKSQAGARLYLNNVDSGVVPATGELELPTLKPETDYKARLELDNYEPQETAFKTALDKEIALNIDLKPLATSAGFEESFLSGLRLWDAPAAWKAESGILHVSGQAAVGLPKNLRYRDCAIRFGLHLTKNRGAAWVIHAKDKNNYYLFYINGANGPFPNQFCAYICRDGKVNLDEPAGPALPIIPPLKDDEYYQVRVTIAGNVIQTYLTPSQTGQEISIGLFKDPQNSFPIGNIGFAVLDGEEYIINGFSIILPNEAKAGH